MPSVACSAGGDPLYISGIAAHQKSPSGASSIEPGAEPPSLVARTIK
jgi:hypothetical protein